MDLRQSVGFTQIWQDIKIDAIVRKEPGVAVQAKFSQPSRYIGIRLSRPIAVRCLIPYEILP